ncbi:MAG: DUF58 domain-containing protein [Deltaproteobacteria bacterium]|nr:DUF58 domain-containing protein [Deltaproteobacteria bacterium]
MKSKAAHPNSRGEREAQDLAALLKRVRQVELKTKRSVNAHAMGAYHSRFKGRGMAFEESRRYVAGDDPRHVDWNVTARTGELFVKQFVEERELTLLLAVDVSGSLSFGSRAKLKRDLAAEAAALLAFSALKNSDKVGLLLFSEHQERLVPPRKGRAHVLRILREILACQPRGKRTSLGEAITTVTHLSKQRAIVALISDMLDPSADGLLSPFSTKENDAPLSQIERSLKVLSRRHELMVVEVLDPAELELPDVGLLSVQDPETGRQKLVDTRVKKTRDLYADRMKSERDALRSRLSRLGVEHVHLSTADDASQALVRFLRARTRTP